MFAMLVEGMLPQLAHGQAQPTGGYGFQLSSYAPVSELALVCCLKLLHLLLPLLHVVPAAQQHDISTHHTGQVIGCYCSSSSLHWRLNRSMTHHW